MGTSKPIVKITLEQWFAKKQRGLAAVIDERPYIVMAHEATQEPVYQPVVILRGESRA